MIYDKSFSFPKAQSYKVSEYKSCSIIRLDNASPMPSYYAHCIKKRALVDMPGSYKMSKNTNIRPQSCSVSMGWVLRQVNKVSAPVLIIWAQIEVKTIDKMLKIKKFIINSQLH